MTYFTEQKPVKGDSPLHLLPGPTPNGDFPPPKTATSLWQHRKLRRNTAVTALPWTVSEGSTASAGPDALEDCEWQAVLNYDADVQNGNPTFPATSARQIKTGRWCWANKVKTITAQQHGTKPQPEGAFLLALLPGKHDE